MKAPTKFQLRIILLALIGGVAVIWLYPFTGSQLAQYESLIDRGWLHFLVFAVIATINMLAWRQPASFITAFGLFAISVGLQLIHNARTGLGIDRFALIANLLGISAGVLLGLNIATLKSRLKQRIELGTAESNDSGEDELEHRNAGRAQTAL